ncbi:MAG TPA: YggT family protein [bacterium]|nr:YggT family protein [bacterium]HQL63737.1 YggT family protein [bacterium]
MVILKELLGFLGLAVQLYIFAIIAAVLMSWVQPNPSNPIVQFIYRITEPFLDTIRRACPFLVVGGLDLSPIAAIMLLEFTFQYLTRIIS